MGFFVEFILSLLGLETDPFVKPLDADKVRDRWKKLEKEYSHIKWVPKTALTKTISRMEDSDFGMDHPVLIAENICHYQNPDGGWGKNGHYRKEFDRRELDRIYEGDSDFRYKRGSSDYDNECTWGHIEYLAEVYRVTEDKKFRSAIRDGVRNIVKGQHKDGSWENKNHPHITYNDGVMTGVMTLLHKIIHNTDDRYHFLDDLVEELDLHKVYKRGLEIILKTQVERDGELRIWGQQHDHETLEPTWARSYEMPAYATSESCAVIDFLKLHLTTNPGDKEVQRSIDAAIAFLRKIRQPDGRWGRYHHLEDLRPIFCDRDSVITYNIEDLSDERRYGYQWWNKSADRHI